MCILNYYTKISQKRKCENTLQKGGKIYDKVTDYDGTCSETKRNTLEES